MSIKTRLIKTFGAVFAVFAVFAFVALPLVGCSFGDSSNELSAYTVIFDSNGGTRVASQKVEPGGKVIEPDDPIKSGNVFVGWYKDSKLAYIWDFDNDVVRADMTLYAKWKSAQASTVCTVTFNSMGGSAVKSVTVTEGGKVSKPTDPTRNGYEFDGWYSDSACTDVWNFGVDTVRSNVILYAKWKKEGDVSVQCTVTFNSMGGSAVKSVTVTEGGKVSKPTDPTRNGYDFDGWYSDSACTRVWNFGIDTVGSNITLYAKWKKKGGTPTPTPGDGTVTATFNVGRDARLEGVSNPPSQSVKSGGSITAPTVTREGYEIDGWYAEGERKWNFKTDTLTADTTLFAEWSSGGKEIEYTPGSDIRDFNTVYIHYKRYSSDYQSWYIYSWNGSSSGFYESNKTDDSGAVYEIPLSDFGISASSSTVFNFIVTTRNWNKDGGDNNISISAMANFGGSYHWFVNEGMVSDGSNKPKLSVGSPYEPVTENKRGSRSNVDRSIAANLSKMPTANETDEMGVGYQIFVASFCDSNGDGVGDLRGITSKLGYLKSLNVDVLWLTPIQSSDSYHGYDCYDYYSIDPKFGTNADYRELVYKAHENGIKVIMDLVVNHTSTSNEWFIKSKNAVVETITHHDGSKEEVRYRDFYRWQQSGGNRMCSAGDGWYYYSSFGSSMPELNYDCQAVRNAMTDVALYWMAYGLDGFRMDAIKHVFMWDESDNAQSDVHAAEYDRGYDYNESKNVEFFKEFNYNLKSKYPNCFLLGEQLSGDVACVSPFYQGMDSLFDFNTYFDLNGKIRSGDAGSQANAFNANAQKYREYRGDRPINSMISSNHDKDRLYNMADGNTEQTKLYFAVIMTLPGLSWIYYGDEIGLQNYGGGDNAFRQSMRWTADWDKKCTVIGYGGGNESVESVEDQLGDNNSLLSYVSDLTELRNAHPSLINGTAVCSADGGILKITVTGETETLTVYHNFTRSTVTVPGGGTAVFGSCTLSSYGTAVFAA